MHFKSGLNTFANRFSPAYSRGSKKNQNKKAEAHMKRLKTITLLLALGFIAGGCSNLSVNVGESKSTAQAGREDLKNAQGHVVGYKDVMRDPATGEEIAQISLFVPRLENGQVVGYEERVRGGSVLRDLNGKRIGGRFVDSRSRGTNPQSKGLLIVVRGKQSDRITTAQAPDIDELRQLARLTN